MKVLLVDDESLVRLSLKRALVKKGHEVVEAADGAEALARWGEIKPDLVFLDVLMPRISGPEVLRELDAADRGDSKVILMSAFSGDYDLARAQSLGADLYIPKPFEDIFKVVEMGEVIAGNRPLDL